MMLFCAGGRSLCANAAALDASVNSDMAPMIAKRMKLHALMANLKRELIQVSKRRQLPSEQLTVSAPPN
jgi:hypothetical protein